MALLSFVANKFELDLGGIPAGWLYSAEGGEMKAEIIAQAMGGMAHKSKHLGTVRAEPITISVGMAMSRPFWQWIRSSWDGKDRRQDGTIFICDYNFDVKFEQTFHQALITETTLPALDAAAKEAAKLVVKFLPEWTELKPSSGKKGTGVIGKTNQKQWSPANFRFQLGKLDCTHVNKIDSFTVKQGTKVLETGEKRIREVVATNLDFPNLTVYLSMAYAESWFRWYEDFVVKGNNSDSNELSGSITYVAPNLTKDLLTIDLKNVGIASLKIDKADSSNDTIKRVKAELYVEDMEFKYIPS